MRRIVTSESRSALMKRVRRADTPCEIIVRKVLQNHGFRYRLHGKDLPGTPDIVNRRKRKAIFVNGCFWHGHFGCSRATLPKRNRTFWKEKIEANRSRDAKKSAALASLGFDVLTIWECETIAGGDHLESTIVQFWER
ncbi:MAG: very short patch repair endonuclease [Thermoanaerobaculia bacterium]